MNYYYCENCKTKAEQPATYAGLGDKSNLPTFKSSVEAPTVTLRDVAERISEMLNSPKYKGEACADCGKDFLLDEVRWVNLRQPINTDDILNRIIAKMSWEKAITLDESMQEKV